MASDQGQDRVAAVVARVAGAWRNTPKPYPVQPRSVMDDLVRALDAAGLLLTEARRERIVRVLGASKALSDPLWEERCALLRELAGDGGAAKDDPVEAVGVLGSYGPSPVVLTPDHPGRWALCPHDVLRSHCEACRGETPPEPTPAPRRMAGHPGAVPPSPHAVEHNEQVWCSAHPPCQPVAAAAHDPRDSDPWEATRDAAYREAAPSCAEHDDPIREGRIVDYIDEQGVEWTRSERVRLAERSSHICAHGIERAWSVEDCTSCRGREHSPEAMAAKPAHEHRWAAVAWDIDPGYRRVTREHCVVGDCRATREVTP